MDAVEVGFILMVEAQRQRTKIPIRRIDTVMIWMHKTIYTFEVLSTGKVPNSEHRPKKSGQ